VTPPWLRLLRPQQWLKNGLLFVPLLAAHRLQDAAAWRAAALAFVGFSLVASAAYVLNDLLDVTADREHPQKRHRPLASGAVAVRHALALAVAAVLAAAGICAIALPPMFAAWLALYALVAVGYSVALKRAVLIDVVVLAALYSLRLLAGGAATAVEVSFWLMVFSGFIFLSLALLKRYAELRIAQGEGRSASFGRAYGVDDLGLLLAAGIASGFQAVLVLALYTQSDAVRALYGAANRVGLVCPIVLLWVLRMWLLAHRGRIPDDPLAFAVRDRGSFVLVALAVLVLVAAV